jgi:hypothetical protein
VALGNNRKRRTILARMKAKVTPFGTGIEGVINASRSELQLPAEDRYIHEIHTVNGVDVVCTMLPYLANLVHSTNALLADDTYKRVHGSWKEWEIVVWNRRLNMRT